LISTGWFDYDALPAMPAPESEHLRKPLNPVDLAATRAGFLDRRHFHDELLNVLWRDNGTTFIRAILGRLQTMATSP
jgi:hypothetical protein